LDGATLVAIFREDTYQEAVRLENLTGAVIEIQEVRFGFGLTCLFFVLFYKDGRVFVTKSGHPC
jgi:hypothetical protein